MAIKCSSCGGKMIFDVPIQALKCHHCKSEMPVDDYSLSNEAEVNKDTYTVTVYTCPNCGAELSAPDEQTVAFCSYCGSESLLTMKQEETIRPKRIIPFKISKEEAVQTYEDALRRQLYVPKELKEGEHLDSFRGIYIPYLSYEFDIPDNSFEFKGTKHYTKDRWEYFEKYDVKAETGGTIKDLSLDASSSFDDTIAREIAPFNTTGKKDFKEAYIAGFYADKLTTPPETYGDLVEKMAVDTFYNNIGERAGGVDIEAPEGYPEKKKQIGIDRYRYKVDLFPVWFLTWKNKERVAYSVMNGQTGRLSMDIPVDKKAFFMVSGIITAVLFIIFSLIPMFILPKTISWAAAIFLMISSFVLSTEIANIYYRENHIFNIGNVNINKEKQKKAELNTRKKKSFFTFFGLFAFLLFVFFGIVNAMGLVIPVIYAMILLIQIVLFIITMVRVTKIEKKTAFLPLLFGILVLGTGLVIGIKNPVHDYWYYGAAILCLLAILGNTISMINYFNYLTTRPVPDFFSREGANHGK